MSTGDHRVMLGNEAISRGLVEAGCQFMTAYPGTPSSEILPAVLEFKKELGLHLYAEWSTNEKVALETALAAAYSGKRAAVAMKQVGLNVAADAALSSAYIGVVGGLILIVADDPGLHSSQTEQDSRLFWDDLKRANEILKAEFFEGVVMDKDNALFPMQLRDPEHKFPFCCKSRWAF